MAMSKSVRVGDELYGRVRSLAKPGESFSQTIERLLRGVNPFAGATDFTTRPDITTQINAHLAANKKISQ